MNEKSSSAPYRFEFVAPPDDLRDRVNTFFAFYTDGGRLEEVMPAYSAQLFVFLQGSGAMHFPEGTQEAPGPSFFNAPLLRASPFSLEGPVCCAGVSFTQHGWASLAGPPVNEAHDRIFACGELLSTKAVERLQSLAETKPKEILQVFDGISDLIRESSININSKHASMIADTVSWLSSAFSPPIDDLYRRLPMSRRQVQRLCNRYFGAPPEQLLKRFRAVRAASLLSQDNLPDAARDEVLSAYFDQSHLINDIRRFTGRTPKLLVEGPLVAGTLDPSGHGPAAKALQKTLTNR